MKRADLAVFFAHQRDPVAARMAAFRPRGRQAFLEHWERRVLGDDRVAVQTILCRGRVAGNIVCFEQAGRRLVGYWIGRDFWGQGVATRALSAFLAHVLDRPLQAFVARHNVASIRVLEKCGFRLEGEEPRGADGVEELLFTLAD